MSKKVTIQPGQTLLDIAIQEYGATDAVSLLLEDNPELTDLTSVSLANVVVLVRTPVPAIEVTNKQIASGFDRTRNPNALPPASLYPIT